MRTIATLTLLGFLALSVHVLAGHAWVHLSGPSPEVHAHGDVHGTHSHAPASESAPDHDPVDHDHGAETVFCKTCAAAAHLSPLTNVAATLTIVPDPTQMQGVARLSSAPGCAIYLSTRSLRI